MPELPKGFVPLGGSTQDMLIALSQRSGGIPDFAKKALKTAMPSEDVDAADQAGKKPKEG